MAGAPIPFSADLEQPQPDEAETHRQLIETFHHIVDTTNKDYGHAYRSVHAKSHALLEGVLTVNEGLPPELAQGIFNQGGRTYPVLLRISTNAGDPLPDTISLPRGLAVKVIGVDGERLPGSEESNTQDFVMAVGTAFQAPDAQHFLSSLKMLAATTDKAEGGKVAISALLRGTNKVLEAIGIESPKVKSLGGYPQTHPLGERYFSQVPIRYGDYVAKVGVVPLSDNLKKLEGQELDIAGRENGIREDMAAYLAETGGSFEFRVQLRRDGDRNPIEDASQPWPEESNPYVAVATIRVEPQSAWSFDRARVLDDETSFAPWHGIAEHRPLGGIMRARKIYDQLSGYRATLNRCPIHDWHEAPTLPA
jgi:hypothetical protein